VRAKGIAAIIVSAFGFALMAFFVRLCDDFGQEISCFQKSFFRNAIALIIACTVLLRGRRKGCPQQKSYSRNDFLLLCLRSLFGVCGIFANFFALSKIPIGEAMTLNKTAPFFTVLLSWLFMGEKISFRQAGALILAFAGAIFVIKPGFAGNDVLYFSVALSGGVFAGLAYVCVHALGKRGVSGGLVVFFFSLFSCIVSLPLAAISYVPMTANQIFIMIGAGIGAAIGQFGVTAAYKYAEPRNVAVYDYTNVVFTSLLGFLFFAQIPDAFSVIGFVIIFSAAFFMRPR
jgi:drug/metabolite transporter (DMT)-like permease